VDSTAIRWSVGWGGRFGLSGTLFDDAFRDFFALECLIFISWILYGFTAFRLPAKSFSFFAFPPLSAREKFYVQRFEIWSENRPPRVDNRKCLCLRSWPVDHFCPRLAGQCESMDTIISRRKARHSPKSAKSWCRMPKVKQTNHPTNKRKWKSIWIHYQF